MPWMKRAATSVSCDHAMPHSSEATVKTPRPAISTLLRPSRSPNRPESSSRPPKAMRYALTTHARLDCEKPRSSWIDGSATFTTVTSSTIISIPAQRTYRAIQRRRSPGTELLGGEDSVLVLIAGTILDHLNYIAPQ